MSEALKCPYEILGVAREAPDDEIKKAYRKLAIMHHPDKNQGSAESTAVFQQIGAAYAILSCPDKRSRYDMTGSLDEDDIQHTDMDDVMQMFFQTFGGDFGGLFGGGGNVFFEMGGSRGRGGSGKFRGASYSDMMFGDFMDGFESDDLSDMGDYDDLINAQIMTEILEITPGLFCHEFINELDELPADPTANPETTPTTPKPLPTNKKKSKHRKLPIFQCKLCSAIMRSTDAAENHFCDAHSSLMNQFIESLEAIDLSEVDIGEIFALFADHIRSGKIKDEKKKKKKKPRGPRVARKQRSGR